MEESSLVHREIFAEVPPRVEYSLTELGATLKPVLDAMRDWGEDYKSVYKCVTPCDSISTPRKA